MSARGRDFFADVRACFGLVQFGLILDVGANVGQSSIRFARECPEATIHAFEPVARAYTELIRNIEKNGLRRVFAHHLALGEEESEKEIFVSEETALSSFVAKSGGAVERVPMTTVDAFCKSLLLHEVALLKIDTEGYDLQVLAGANDLLRAGLARFVQVEASFYGLDPRFRSIGEFVQLLSQFGYEVFGIYEQMPHLSGRASIGYFNAVFVNRRLLNGAT